MASYRLVMASYRLVTADNKSRKWSFFQYVIAAFSAFLVLSQGMNASALSIEVAGNTEECVYFYANSTQRVKGNIETFYSPSVMDVSIKGTYSLGNGALTAENQVVHKFLKSGPIELEISEAGMYSLCFINQERFHQFVGFSLHVLNSDESAHIEELATALDSEDVNKLGRIMVQKVTSTMDEQSNHFVRTDVYAQITEATNRRVLWWTICQVLVVVGLFLLQYFYMRRFFEVKTIV